MRLILEKKIESFYSEVSLGVTFFESAGKKLVDILDADAHAFDEILNHADKPDWLTRDTLSTFEAIGRKTLTVEAMFMPKHVLQRVIELPVGTQVQIATNPVRVHNGAGRGRFIDKPANRLTRKEAKIAIGPKGIRSESEQTRIASEIGLVKFQTVGVITICKTAHGYEIAELHTPATQDAQVVRFEGNKATIILKKKTA